MTAPTVTVTGRYRYANGQPATGRVEFTPDTVVIDTTTGEQIETTPVVAILGRDAAGFSDPGFFSVNLTATNGTGVNPSGWGWTVREQIHGVGSNREPYSISLPFNTSGGTVDISDLVPETFFEPTPLSSYALISSVNAGDAALQTQIDALPDPPGDATSTTAGLIRLAGDLGGTAAAPTVNSAAVARTLGWTIVAGTPDGSTNNTAAVTAALAALPAPVNSFGAGGTIWFGPGRWMVDPGILALASLTATIAGAGKGVTILYRRFGGTVDFVTLGAGNSGIRDLTLDGGNAGTAGDGLVLNAGYTFADNVDIRNFRGNCVTIGKAGTAILHRLSRVTIRLAGAYGVEVVAGSGSTDGQWNSVDIGQCGLSGYKLGTGAQNLVNVHTWGNGIAGSGSDKDGAWVNSVDNNLTQCQSETNLGRGFYVGGAGSHRNRFTGCTSWGNAGAGLYGFSSNQIVIHGGAFYNNGVNNDGSNTSAFAAISNESGTEWDVNTTCYDTAAAIPAGSYTTTPTLPYPGRTAVFSQSQNYFEVNTGSGTPDLNRVAGVMRKQRTKSGIAYTTLGPGTRVDALTGNVTQVRKTADGTAVNNSTTLVNDPELALQVDSNSTYRVEGFIVWDSSTAADVKFNFTGPTGATMTWVALAPGVTTASTIASLQTATNTLGSTTSYGGNGAGTKVATRIEGTLNTSTGAGAAGTLQFRWAQNTADPTDTFVRADSRLAVYKLTN